MFQNVPHLRIWWEMSNRMWRIRASVTSKERPFQRQNWFCQNDNDPSQNTSVVFIIWWLLCVQRFVCSTMIDAYTNVYARADKGTSSLSNLLTGIKSQKPNMCMYVGMYVRIQPLRHVQNATPDHFQVKYSWF